MSTIMRSMTLEELIQHNEPTTPLEHEFFRRYGDELSYAQEQVLDLEGEVESLEESLSKAEADVGRLTDMVTDVECDASATQQLLDELQQRYDDLNWQVDDIVFAAFNYKETRNEP